MPVPAGCMQTQKEAKGGGSDRYLSRGASPCQVQDSHTEWRWRQWQVHLQACQSLPAWSIDPTVVAAQISGAAASCHLRLNTEQDRRQWQLHLQTCQSLPGSGFKHQMKVAAVAGTSPDLPVRSHSALTRLQWQLRCMVLSLAATLHRTRLAAVADTSPSLPVHSC